MQHIVERIIDGLPVYLKEDYPRFVELLRAYYTWQAGEGKFLGVSTTTKPVLTLTAPG